jgi:hypothetical protein
MESVRDKWTDERLDDLNQRVDSGFGEMRDQLRDVRNEMRDEFGDVRKQMRAEFGAVHGEIQGVRQEIHAIGARTTERMNSIQRSIMQLAVALTTAMVAGFAGIFALLAAAL